MKNLVKIQLKGIYSSIFMRLNPNKRLKLPLKILLGIFVVYIIAAILFSLGATFYGMGELFISLGVDEFYFMYGAFTTTLLCILGSFFTASSLLFESKDNELLLSMPIKHQHIFASRLLTLLILEYLYTLVITLPMVVVYELLASLTITQYILILLGSLMYPLFALCIACLLGYVVAFVSSQIKYKNLVQTGLLILLFVGYLFLMVHLQDYMAHLLENGEQLMQIVSKVYPPIYYFSRSIVDVSFSDFFILMMMCMLPTLIVFIVLAINYQKILMTKKQDEHILKQSGSHQEKTPFQALLQRELFRFVSMSMYMFNAGAGVLMHVVLGGYLFFEGDKLMPYLSTVSNEFNWLVIALMALITTMNQITAPSISLEGENLWILKTSPVSEKTIFHAKILTHVMVSNLGSGLAGIFVMTAMEMTTMEIVFLFAYPLLMSILVAIIGLICNLYLPNLHFTNPTLVVKQSGSVLASMLISMAFALSPIILYIALDLTLSLSFYALLWFFIYLVLTFVLYFYLMREGIHRFRKIY